MPGDFQPLYEDDKAGAFKDGKEKLKKHIAAKIAKKGLKHAASEVFGLVTHGVGGTVFEAYAIYSTHQHIQALTSLEGPTVECTCTLTPCGPNLAYVIKQKKRKLKNTSVSVVPGLGALNKLRTTVHHFTKKDQGRKRELVAHQLWNNARNGCPKAKAIIAELLGGWENQRGKAAAEATIELDNGFMWVKEKLTAT